jgi:hypothetical protein
MIMVAFKSSGEGADCWLLSAGEFHRKGRKGREEVREATGSSRQSNPHKEKMDMDLAVTLERRS